MPYHSFKVGQTVVALLAGRMRIYRMGRSLLYDCSHWLLTSVRSTVDGHERVVTEQQIKPVDLKRTGQGRFQPGGNSAEGAGCRVPPRQCLAVGNLAISMGC